MKLLGITNIVTELSILKEISTLDKSLQRGYKIDKRNLYLKNLKYDFIITDPIIINNFRSKFPLWCLLDTGPFKHFLYKIGKAADSYCRYCNLELETFDHFYFNCEKFKNTVKDHNFEQSCKQIVKKLYQDQYLL